MKTITIQITVPDDVSVTVNGAMKDTPFVPQPDPPYPDDQSCPIHDTGWRLIRAGVSKTKVNPDGTPKRFNAFYVCATEGCSEKPRKAEDVAFTDLSDPMPF